MTRERAIEVLIAWDLNWSDEFTANEFEQAFAMAVSALSEKDNTMEWIHKPHIYGVTYCSKCDYENKVDDTKFCPNCGRKAVNK